eukprot:247450-Amphidinium_carterae.1
MFHVTSEACCEHWPRCLLPELSFSYGDRFEHPDSGVQNSWSLMESPLWYIPAGGLYTLQVTLEQEARSAY